jgi:hypothetical protein
MTPAGDQHLPEQIGAHHALLLAIPAVVPAIVVVAVVLYIARKDRLDERMEHELIDRAFEKDEDE